MRGRTLHAPSRSPDQCIATRVDTSTLCRRIGVTFRALVAQGASDRIGIIEPSRAQATSTGNCRAGLTRDLAKKALVDDPVVHFENVVRKVLLELGARGVFEQEKTGLRLPVVEKDEQIVADPAASKVVRIVVAKTALSALQQSYEDRRRSVETLGEAALARQPISFMRAPSSNDELFTAQPPSYAGPLLTMTNVPTVVLAGIAPSSMSGFMSGPRTAHTEPLTLRTLAAPLWIGSSGNTQPTS